MSDLVYRIARAILRQRMAQAGHTGDDAWFERQWRSGPFPDLLEEARAALRECESWLGGQGADTDEQDAAIRTIRAMIRSELDDGQKTKG